MKTSEAKKINAAACVIYLEWSGVSAGVTQSHIDTINSASIAKIETAVDVIQADNNAENERLKKEGSTIFTINQHIAISAIPKVKEIAASQKATN